MSVPVAVLNTAILTADGDFTLQTISLEAAKALVASPAGFLSAIGHESTAQILTELLDVEIRMNRIEFVQQPQQVALVFKLNGRAPEGTILTAQEIERIGYSLKKLTRVA